MFLEDVTDMLDEGDPVDVIYRDFQNAFDKVYHQGNAESWHRMVLGAMFLVGSRNCSAIENKGLL